MLDQEATGNHLQEPEVEPNLQANVDAQSGAKEPKPFEKLGIINAQQSCALLK